MILPILTIEFINIFYLAILKDENILYNYAKTNSKELLFGNK